MSAIAGILADRGFGVSGSDPKDNAVLADLRSRGVRVFLQQSAATITAILATPSPELGQAQPGPRPLVVVSSAVPSSNPELMEARRLGLEVCHRSDVLGALIRSQSAIAIAGSHGKTTTSTMVATLLAGTNQDPTAVIGGIVPAFGSNGRSGAGALLVAEADESDGSLVKFPASLGVITNLELDHTDHYPDLDSLISTLQQFAQGCQSLLANWDDPVLRQHFDAQAWWSVVQTEAVDFAAIPVQLNGDSCVADFHEGGQLVGRFTLPLPGLHNLSNATGALAACRLQGVPFADLSEALASLQAAGLPSAIYYPKPLHRQPAYAAAHASGLAAGPPPLPVSESLCTRCLSLPMHPYLAEEDVARVAQAVLAAV
jgi:UDP-N-acetylmuramate--alanine ligase